MIIPDTCRHNHKSAVGTNVHNPDFFENRFSIITYTLDNISCGICEENEFIPS
jgi:hypothetical protein